MSSAKDRWFDREAGPVVRSYALTQGRTRPAGQAPVDLLDVAEATGAPPTETFRPGPECRRILSLCAEPVTVADLASEIDLAIGVVCVLLSDLSSQGLIRLYRTSPGGSETDERLLRKVLNGLQAL